MILVVFSLYFCYLICGELRHVAFNGRLSYRIYDMALYTQKKKTDFDRILSSTSARARAAL